MKLRDRNKKCLIFVFWHEIHQKFKNRPKNVK